MIIIRAIVLIVFAVFAGGTLIWIPYMLVKGALFSIIGRPFGFGWMRITAALRPYEPKQDPQIQIPLETDSSIKYAEYTVGGTNYRRPVLRKVTEETCVIYVHKKNPGVIWQSAYENRFTAVTAVVLVAGIWFGLVLGGILIFNAARG